MNVDPTIYIMLFNRLNGRFDSVITTYALHTLQPIYVIDLFTDIYYWEDYQMLISHTVGNGKDAI